MGGIKAKKTLGQHFLRSKTALGQIMVASSLSAQDTVLEIGPGEGVLTEELLASGARVIAVETDERCILALQERFKGEITEGRFMLIAGDIRNADMEEKLFQTKYLGKDSYKLVANIPYYITGMLFRLFLEHFRQPSLVVFLVQKEVADEIVARDGKEGILSLSVKIYGDPRIVAKVKKEAFSPPPKVDSAIIAIENISRERQGALSDEEYFRVVKAGLHARRKMLLGNLAHELDLSRAVLTNIFSMLEVPTSVRGEDLEFGKWVSLAREITTQRIQSGSKKPE